MANEKRLIDANALSDRVDENKHDNPHPQGMIRVNHRNEHDHFLRMILDAPTVDAVEVVRCRDCKHMYCCSAVDRMFHCRHPKGLKGMPNIVEENPFCPYGERREGE